MLAAGLRSLGALLLCVSVLLVSGWSLRPGNGPAPESREVRVPSGALQEVAPPAAVQRFKARMEEREPKVRILSPAADSLVAAGPWEVELEVTDWPLIDAGTLGLGPHLGVRLDDQAPVRVTSSQTGSVLRVVVPMAPLRPGSHRLTAYASLPWGEAIKAPGALAQIRIHRVAPNPAALPRPGSPQLISATPTDLTAAEPVLIDWLLLDAPLQRLRDGERRWELRVTINGDSFLVDRQTPLWLTGLQDGGNAVQLELLDGLGDPLNPPFNSLVEELSLRPGDQSRWQQGPLTAEELDRYLGMAPAAGAVHEVPADEAGAASPRLVDERALEPLLKQEQAEAQAEAQAADADADADAEDRMPEEDPALDDSSGA